MTRVKPKNGKYPVYADCETFNAPIDLHAQLKAKNVVIEGGNIQVTASSDINAVSNTLDVMQWLPACALSYMISSKLEDYILLPTIICPADIPNRNGVSFPLKELLKWEPDMHQQVYKAWKGCPTYSEHANTDRTQARGVVLDSVMKPVKGFRGNLFKVVGLTAFDRNKYPEVAHRILTRETTTVSMGAMVTGYMCSVCRSVAGHCGHINLRRPVDFYIDGATGKLANRMCFGISPFEVSEVKIPAWTVASGPLSIDLKDGSYSTGGNYGY